MKNLFLKLVKIPSPSGHEGKIAKFIAHFFSNLNINTSVDKNGNILGHLPGEGKTILLVAHMDTVQLPGEIIRPKYKNGVFKSDGTTILGADNKAGVTVLLETVKEMSKVKLKPNLYFSFTTNEESGEMGSSKLDISSLKPKVIINIDGKKDPGTIDVMALGQIVFEIEIIGKSAHAAAEPEKGIHAIKVAAEILHKLNLGKNKQFDTINIGQIEGGRSTNIIPDWTSMRGEIRSFSKKRLNNKYNKISNIINFISKKYNTKINLKAIPKIGAPVWEKRINKKLLSKLSSAAKKSRLKFEVSEMKASSDANYLANYGAPTVSINRGGGNPHSNSEFIRLKDMQKTKRFLLRFLQEF